MVTLAKWNQGKTQITINRESVELFGSAFAWGMKVSLCPINKLLKLHVFFHWNFSHAQVPFSRNKRGTAPILHIKVRLRELRTTAYSTVRRGKMFNKAYLWLQRELRGIWSMAWVSVGWAWTLQVWKMKTKEGCGVRDQTLAARSSSLRKASSLRLH